MADNFDFRFCHSWGGAYVMPQTEAARDWCAHNLDPDYEDWEGDYLIPHAEGVDVALAIRAAGLTFPNMGVLH